MVQKYQIIAKVGRDDFKKWNASNLLTLTNFLDKKYPSWRWFNVYDKKTKNQLANYTNKKRPTTKSV